MTEFNCKFCNRPMQVSLLEYKSNSYCNKCFDERADTQPVDATTLNSIEFMGEVIPLDNIITPQEKAIELYNKFYILYLHPNSINFRQEAAKKCALVVCNEVLGHMGADRGYAFWSEVKEEIEKL